MSNLFQGIFIIPCTPFVQKAGVLAVDEASLRNLANYIVKAGAHGNELVNDPSKAKDSLRRAEKYAKKYVPYQDSTERVITCLLDLL